MKIRCHTCFTNFTTIYKSDIMCNVCYEKKYAKELTNLYKINKPKRVFKPRKGCCRLCGIRSDLNVCNPCKNDVVRMLEE